MPEYTAYFTSEVEISYTFEAEDAEEASIIAEQIHLGETSEHLPDLNGVRDVYHGPWYKNGVEEV